MARIRTIKPEFWIDERVASCSMPARLLFIAIWNFADDRGGIDRSAKQLKAQAFPHDVIDAEPLVRELLAAGLLVEYSANGRYFLHVKGWHHQKIDNPGKPRVPVYEPSAVTVEDSASPRGVLGENSRLMGREGIGREKDGSLPSAADAAVTDSGRDSGTDPSVPRETFDGWKFCELRIRPVYPAGTYRDNSWIVASREIETLVGDGLAPEALENAAMAYSEQQRMAGKIGSPFILSPATFFHRGLGHFRGPFPAPETDATRKDREAAEKQQRALAEAWQLQSQRAASMGYRGPEPGESLDSFRQALDARVTEIEKTRKGSGPARVEPRPVRRARP